MENKKKKSNNIKIESGKGTAAKTAGTVLGREKEITDWFYMTPKDVTAKMIADLIKKQGIVQVDLWEEMNILQLELADKTTADFEPVIIDFKDPSDAAFVKNRNIRTIFEVTVEENALPEMKPVLKLIFQEWGGFFCADTDDFHPIYGMDNL